MEQQATNANNGLSEGAFFIHNKEGEKPEIKTVEEITPTVLMRLDEEISQLNKGIMHIMDADLKAYESK